MKGLVYSLNILMVYVLLDQSFGRPLENSPPWQKPCGDSRMPTTNITIDVPLPKDPLSQSIPPEKELLVKVIQTLSEIRSTLRKIKEDYRKSRLQYSFNECGKNLDAPFLYVEKFPLPQNITSIFTEIRFKNVSDILASDYIEVATALVFIEQIKWDEEAYNRNEMKDNLERVFYGMKGYLCDIDRFTSSDIQSYPDRDVMSPKYRVMSRDGRTDRDYVVVKQADVMIGKLIFKYTAMKNILF